MVLVLLKVTSGPSLRVPTNFVLQFTGPIGQHGDRGSVGPTGPKGHRGYMGMPGFRGIPGNPGLPGETGIKGGPGTPGCDGVDGKAGIPGDIGSSGPDGPPGKIATTHFVFWLLYIKPKEQIKEILSFRQVRTVARVPRETLERVELTPLASKVKEAMMEYQVP